MWWWRYRRHIQDNEVGTGFGLSFDQEVSDNITSFLRFGYMGSGDIYEARYSWSLGGQMSGTRWNRPDDMIGVAYGQAMLSSEYERYLNAFDVNPGNEGHFEIYYRYQVNDHLAISPDYQLISNITGAEEAHNVSVFGVRGQIDF